MGEAHPAAPVAGPPDRGIGLVRTPALPDTA
jgi:hypothetical protein